MNYYELLGINRDASKSEIKSAYRACAKKYHPDVNNAPNATYLFKKINEGYEILIDDEKRQKYDFELKINKKTYTEPKEEPSTESKSERAKRQQKYTEKDNSNAHKDNFENKKEQNMIKIYNLFSIIIVVSSIFLVLFYGNRERENIGPIGELVSYDVLSVEDYAPNAPYLFSQNKVCSNIVLKVNSEHKQDVLIDLDQFNLDSNYNSNQNSICRMGNSSSGDTGLIFVNKGTVIDLIFEVDKGSQNGNLNYLNQYIAQIGK